MKKSIITAVLLASILMFTACSNGADESSLDQTETQTESTAAGTAYENNSTESTVELLTNLQAESSITECESDVGISAYVYVKIDPREETDGVTFGKESGVNTQDKSGISNFNIVGTPLEYKYLQPFVFEHKYQRYLDYFFPTYDILDNLDNEEQKELYFKASAMLDFVSDTVGFEIADQLDRHKKYAGKDYDVYIEYDKGGYHYTYIETGYTYDSFLSVLCDIFTEETAKAFLDKYPIFCEYNGELWYFIGSSGDNAWAVRNEYELVNKTDTVLEFRRIRFRNDYDDPAGQAYDPAKRDEYIKEYFDYKFVLTEKGWRAEKFLEPEDPNEGLVFH